MDRLFYMDVLLISTTMGNLSNPFMFISKNTSMGRIWNNYGFNNGIYPIYHSINY